jgi:hypothetical protein
MTDPYLIRVYLTLASLALLLALMLTFLPWRE